jgi:dTDP-4-amino-4,6-dideoxygalactose transaminase
MIDKLAIFGASPAFESPLHVGRPNIGNEARLMSRFEEILKSRWLTNRGKFVQEFEQRIADLVGVDHCIAMCNGTVAMEIVSRALGMKGEVIVPSMTFIATAHALQWQQITPVFCDIHPQTHTLDPDRVEAMITPRTTGIVGVHLWSRPCEIDALTDLAKRYNLKLIFDAAHAFGCSYQGKMIGGFGNAEVLSFHATKVMNTFEGGAVTTNDAELAEKIRLMQNFGFRGKDNVIHIGTNGKMSEISSAMGLTSLESLEAFIDTNKRNYELYRAEIATMHGISLVPIDRKEKSNYHYVVSEVDESVCGLSRDELMSVLHAENVIARRYFFPGCHRMEPYRSYFPHAHLLLPETEEILQRVLVLPTGSAVGADEILTTCKIIRYALKHKEKVKSRLRGRQKTS